MQIDIVAIGKLKEKYWREAQAEYVKRLGRFSGIQIKEIAEERISENASIQDEENAKQKEGQRILAATSKSGTSSKQGTISKQGMNIVLDLSGKTPDSPQLAQLFQGWMNHGQSQFSFIIGGSNGLSDEVVQSADYLLCLSKLTFPHQMARIVLLEQIYRAMKINANETYHK